MRGLCRGDGTAVRRLAGCNVGAAVTDLTTAGYTVKLAAVTRASRCCTPTPPLPPADLCRAGPWRALCTAGATLPRLLPTAGSCPGADSGKTGGGRACRIVVLHKRTLAVVLLLEGLPTGAHPVRAAMDPSRGRWLLAGGDDGRLYSYSLSPPQAGGAVAVLPCMVADIALTAAARHGPPLYCVAWSPTLHMVAVCSCRRAGYVTMLCSPAGGEGQRCGPLATACVLHQERPH